VTLVVPADALEAYEAALLTACGTVGLFLDEDSGLWTLEGVKDQGEAEGELASALAIAALVSGVAVTPSRRETPADGWLARTYQSFPEQLVGRRFAVRGTHLSGPGTAGRIILTLDAGIAFGSGEHGSTRGCLASFERVAYRKPRNILDLGTGSGILAMAAARLLHRRVLGTDIEPWSVRVAGENARLNGLGRRARFVLANGWTSPIVRAGAPYDLVFANILARPLCRMAASLARNMASGGTVILAGLLDSQVRMVVAAHRRQGLRLEGRHQEGRWSTLVLRKA
jgi:ribosomal protein L11 methyltransferase